MTDAPPAPKANDQTETLPRFAELDLPASLQRAVQELGYTHTTDIQAKTLPVIAAGGDVAAQAQTGTGKTAAFLLGSFARLLKNDGGERDPNQPRMLVLAPTRELALQIKKDADALGQYSDLRTVVAYGGIDYEKQRDAIAAGTDVIIGTPGRLIDYFKQRVFNLKKLEICVLDEADRMFDLGFIADIRFLLRRMPAPEERLSMLFSATLSHRVLELAYEHMNEPQLLKTDREEVTASGVRQRMFQPASDEKIPLLLGLMQQMQPSRSIVFVNTKRAAETVDAWLNANGVSCGTLSGDVRQKKRQSILSDFTKGELPVLIATDVAARGLHIDNVTHVFNYDLPQNAEDYVHRIGRTARAGAQGEALSFVCEEYAFSLPDILEYIGQDIENFPIEDSMLANATDPGPIARAHRGKREGQRGGGGSRREGQGRPRRDGARTAGRRRPRRGEGSGPASDQNGAEATSTPPPRSGPATQQAANPDDTPRKKRRRRRRRPKNPASASGESSAGNGTDTGV